MLHLNLNRVVKQENGDLQTWTFPIQIGYPVWGRWLILSFAVIIKH